MFGLCDYGDYSLAAESRRVIGRCSDSKHYLGSVELVKCSLRALTASAHVCVCMLTDSAWIDFKL